MEMATTNEMKWRTSACAVLLLGLAAAVSSAQTLTTVADFDGADGTGPNSVLVQGTDGNFYGTTEFGGANNLGTVFKMTPAGALTTLHSFCSQPGVCTDGLTPNGLVQATDGNFYGTTIRGGTITSNCNGFNTGGGCGTVFKITPTGQLTTLYKFCSQPNCTDGFIPLAPLVQGTDGNLYGTTAGGGIGPYETYGNGTIFKMTPTGALTTLYRFCSLANCADGSGPGGTSGGGGLVQATDGNFYGTTWGGGTSNVGTVFKITAGGTLTTLHSFDGADGGYPNGTLVQGSDGNFYGTERGGVFKITPEGALTPLASLDFPYAGLVQATDGNFYGTEYTGGIGDGSIFKITSDGVVTPLYSFCSQANCTDGYAPIAGVMQAANGKLYGTTLGGGTFSCVDYSVGYEGCGTIYSLDVGLSRPGKPSLSGAITHQSFSGTTLTLTLALTDTGTGDGKNIFIDKVTLLRLGGSGSVALISPALPLPIGDLAARATVAVPLSFTVASTVTKFLMVESGTVEDDAGNIQSYSTEQIVSP
jgi:uncharacterized repeat protein (TIGR03803 family)